VIATSHLSSLRREAREAEKHGHMAEGGITPTGTTAGTGADVGPTGEYPTPSTTMGATEGTPLTSAGPYATGTGGVAGESDLAARGVHHREGPGVCDCA
jgi:hypothetical protein